MNSFVDYKKISSYSNALAEKLVADFFSRKEKISGEEIKTFTGIEQINLFILKNLFEKWQEETSKLRSPYFDYSNPEVQTSLSNLLNTLSRHILISREFFRPLVITAIEDTLVLTLSPQDYFRNLFKEPINKVTAAGKFIKLNKDIYSKAIERSSHESIETFLNGLGDFVNPTRDEIIKKLSDFLKIEINEVLLQPQLVQGKTTVATPDISVQKDIFHTSSEIIPEPAPVKNNIEEPTKEASVSINDKFVKQELTLNEILSARESSAAEPGKKLEKIQDLRSAVPLSEKFMFIKELFNDDPSAYAVALADLEKLSNINEAVNYIHTQVVPKYRWEESNPALSYFMELIERRFMA